METPYGLRTLAVEQVVLAAKAPPKPTKGVPVPPAAGGLIALPERGVGAHTPPLEAGAPDGPAEVTVEVGPPSDGDAVGPEAVTAGENLEPRMVGPTVGLASPAEGEGLAVGATPVVRQPAMDTVVVPAALASLPSAWLRAAASVAKATGTTRVGGSRVRRPTKPVRVVVIAPEEAGAAQAVATGRAARPSADAAAVQASLAEATRVAAVPDVPASPSAVGPPFREKEVR